MHHARPSLGNARQQAVVGVAPPSTIALGLALRVLNLSQPLKVALPFILRGVYFGCPALAVPRSHDLQVFLHSLSSMSALIYYQSSEDACQKLCKLRNTGYTT